MEDVSESSSTSSTPTPSLSQEPELPPNNFMEADPTSSFSGASGGREPLWPRGYSSSDGEPGAFNPKAVRDGIDPLASTALGRSSVADASFNMVNSIVGTSRFRSCVRSQYTPGQFAASVAFQY